MTEGERDRAQDLLLAMRVKEVLEKSHTSPQDKGGEELLEMAKRKADSLALAAMVAYVEGGT